MGQTANKKLKQWQKNTCRNFKRQLIKTIRECSESGILIRERIVGGNKYGGKDSGWVAIGLWHSLSLSRTLKM